MAGDRDPLFPPEQMSDLGRYATTVRTELLDDVGHRPATEAPRPRRPERRRLVRYPLTLRHHPYFDELPADLF
ncbi:MAG TPA: hypothetical protein VG247_14380 [Pseudonocardiaceae bacterium]|jgi:pimeloyl-ACP methyl ester carboxylesterase|nr:hypothetical protein [Pseudonocardiaceae bacterium]